jgi:hypothetical protein
MKFNPLRLTSDYWEELGKMASDGVVPVELANCLRALINAEQYDAFTPHATPELIRQAQKHVAHGISYTDEKGEKLFDVMVFMPDSENAESHISVFRLIEKYPAGRLRYLDHVNVP